MSGPARADVRHQPVDVATISARFPPARARVLRVSTGPQPDPRQLAARPGSAVAGHILSNARQGRQLCLIVPL